MSSVSDGGGRDGGARQERAGRLAASLRQNLHRRKAQARARRAEDGPVGPMADAGTGAGPEDAGDHEQPPQSGPAVATGAGEDPGPSA